jgi:hypothetical protein
VTELSAEAKVLSGENSIFRATGRKMEATAQWKRIPITVTPPFSNVASECKEHCALTGLLEHEMSVDFRVTSREKTYLPSPKALDIVTRQRPEASWKVCGL